MQRRTATQLLAIAPPTPLDPPPPGEELDIDNEGALPLRGAPLLLLRLPLMLLALLTCSQTRASDGACRDTTAALRAGPTHRAGRNPCSTAASPSRHRHCTTPANADRERIVYAWVSRPRGSKVDQR